MPDVRLSKIAATNSKPGDTDRYDTVARRNETVGGKPGTQHKSVGWAGGSPTRSAHQSWRAWPEQQ